MLLHHFPIVRPSAARCAVPLQPACRPVAASEVKQLLRDGCVPGPQEAASLGSCQVLSPVRSTRKVSGLLGGGEQVGGVAQAASKPRAAALGAAALLPGLPSLPVKASQCTHHR